MSIIKKLKLKDNGHFVLLRSLPLIFNFLLFGLLLGGNL